VLEIVGLMSALAMGLLVSMATVGAVAVLVCGVAGGGCWMWLRRRRSKADQPEQ
jgi:uncharacterized iron-regulated membrane protein